MKKNKKRGFTLIELIVCFALVTVVSLSIFKTVLSMQEKQVKNISYNSYLSFVSVLNNTIQNDFLTDTISNVESCGNNCFNITYLQKGVVRLEADRENNTILYGENVEKLPNNYEIYKDITFNNYASITTGTLDSYYLLKLPIKSDLFPNMDDVKYMHQYSSNVSRENKYILRLELDGGSMNDTNENTLYGSGTIVNLPIPIRNGFEFTGWEKSSGNGVLSGNTITIGTNNTVVKAKWEKKGIKYSELMLDFSCQNQTVGESPYIFEYGGVCEIINDENEDWRIKLKGDLTSHAGTHNLIFNQNVFVDVFLVGAGGGGGGANTHMGGVGGGGYTATYFNIELRKNTYQITIGKGGNAFSTGQSSSLVGLSQGDLTALGGSGGVTNGKGGAGGSGGGGPGNTPATSTGGSFGGNGKTGSFAGGTGQGTTTCEFEQSLLNLKTDLSGCAVGVTAYAGGGAGSAGYYASVGGQGGGGNYGVAGAANTGGGGGAYSSGNGAAGGSGIIIIRNHRYED